MPDISMCMNDNCPLSTTCYRSSDSGTKPSEFMQTYFSPTPTITKDSVICDYYWPTKDK